MINYVNAQRFLMGAAVIAAVAVILGLPSIMRGGETARVDALELRQDDRNGAAGGAEDPDRHKQGHRDDGKSNDGSRTPEGASDSEQGSESERGEAPQAEGPAAAAPVASAPGASDDGDYSDGGGYSGGSAGGGSPPVDDDLAGGGSPPVDDDPPAGGSPPVDDDPPAATVTPPAIEQDEVEQSDFEAQDGGVDEEAAELQDAADTAD
jgi:hypothetical protein